MTDARVRAISYTGALPDHTRRDQPARLASTIRSDVANESTRVSCRSAFLVFAVMTAVAGCLKPPAPAPSDPIGTGRVVVTVHNNYRADINVYVVRDGQPVRVGTATAATTTSFDVPSRLLGQGRQLRLRADPIGGRSVHTSELIRVGPGQRIDWTLETDLSRSSIAVY